LRRRARWLAWFILCGATALARDNPKSATPKWTINLLEKFEFQAFDRTISYPWSLHQDVVFLSPDKVLVYQVNRSHAPARLAPRDASGGGGNFVLNIKVLSTLDGREIKALSLATNAFSSKVLATQGGRFVVRTGDILYLYSANFEQITSRALPLQREVQEEGWQVGISPSGTEVALVHQQIFKRNQLSPGSDVEKAGTEVEVLNEETLTVLEKFSLPWFLESSWSVGEHALVSSRPAPSADPAAFGLLDYRGNWSPLLFAANPADHSCAYRAAAIDARLFVTYGCGTLSVSPREGKAVFSLISGLKEHIGSVKGNGGMLAVELERHVVKTDKAANVPVRTVRPLRIDVYDTAKRKAVLSVPVHGERVYYSLAVEGVLAVVDGTSLALYRPEQ
jgi:hypothetical protein